MIFKKNILLFLITIVAVTNLYAQKWDNYQKIDSLPNGIVFTGDTNNFADYQTIGSVALYYAMPDQSIKNDIGKDLRNSLFQWAILKDTTSNQNLSKKGIHKKYNEDAGLVPLTKDSAFYTKGLKYYTDNLVAVNWIDTGLNYVGVAEQYLPYYGNVVEPTIDQYTFTNVYVLPVPSYSFPDTNSVTICNPESDSMSFKFPLNLWGIGDFNVKIKVDFYRQKLTGGVVTDTISFDRFVISKIEFNDHLWDYQKALNQYDIMQRKEVEIMLYKKFGWGRYEISITNVSDQVSRKSLVDINSKRHSFDAMGKYYIYVMPTTAEPKIIHLRDLNKK